MRVAITSPKGASLETEAFWINISQTTGMPTRISDDGIAVLQRTADEHRLKWKAWLTEPLPAPSSTDFEFPLRVTDIDAFYHVHNAAYWQAVEHVAAESGFELRKPFRALLDFREPVDLGDELELTEHLDGPVLQLGFCVDGNVRAVARVEPVRASG